MNSKMMKRLTSIIVAISLFVSFVLPVSANEIKNNVNEFTFTSQDGVTYTASIVEHGKGSLTTTVSGSNGYYEVAKATRINEETVLIESGGETVESNLPSINTDSISPEELVTPLSSYVKKGTIVYNTPIGLSGYPHIDFLYNHYKTDNGIVNLNQMVGWSIGSAISAITSVFGVKAGPMVWAAIYGVLVFVFSEVISYVISDTVQTEWYDYEIRGRKDGFLSNLPTFGTTYSIRDHEGNEIDRRHHGITPETWTSNDSAIELFSQFYSLAIYNGWSYFIWA